MVSKTVCILFALVLCQWTEIATAVAPTGKVVALGASVTIAIGLSVGLGVGFSKRKDSRNKEATIGESSNEDVEDTNEDNDSSLFGISSTVCKDRYDFKYVFDLSITCFVLMRDNTKRQKFCKKSTIRDACKNTCGTDSCCGDDPDFRFSVNDVNEACDWITRNSNNVETRRENWCNEFKTFNGKSYKIKELCRESCAKCKTPVAHDNRNPKRGVAFSLAPGCDVLDRHYSSSWWYSWKPTTGFSEGFCNEYEDAATQARNMGFEFVPMMQPEFPDPNNLSADVIDNLQKATYMMTLNEPEHEGSQNVTALEAAQQWPNFVSIANTYNLQIVGPCGTSSAGLEWHRDWRRECKNLYNNTLCRFDHQCLHYYKYPGNAVTYPNAPHCPSNIDNFMCSLQDTRSLTTVLQNWKDLNGNRPIWVTEFACNPKDECKAAGNSVETAIMKQNIRILEQDTQVFRYAHYSATVEPANLNKREFFKTKDKSCNSTHTLGTYNSIGKCYRAARNSTNCQQKTELRRMHLIVSGTNCKCATDACGTKIDSSWNLWTQHMTNMGRDLTTLGELYQK